MKENGKIYLVTGAAGFLGSTVCRQLVERGDRVRALVLPGDKAAQYLPAGVERCEGDVCDEASLARFLAVPEGCEGIVIHCASIVTVSPEYSQRVVDVNYGGTLNIIRQCQATPAVRRLVYVSSTGCIPEQPHGTPIREVEHYRPEGLRDCYSQTKARATQAVLDAARSGLDACVVFPSGILGPDDYAVGHTTRVLVQIIKGEMSAAIDGSFNLCDVRDLAAGTIAAAERGQRGGCYILGNEAVSFREFSRLVSEESGCRRVRLFLPGKLAYRLASLMEHRAGKRGKKPQMTTYAVWNLIRNNTFDSSRARTELGYRTRPYRETIHDEIQWLKAEGLVG